MTPLTSALKMEAVYPSETLNPLTAQHSGTTEHPSGQGLRLVGSPSQSLCVPFVDMFELHPPPALSGSQAGLWLVPAIIRHISVAHKQLVCGSSARTTLQERHNRIIMADEVRSNQHTNNNIRTRFNAEPYIMQKIWIQALQYTVIILIKVQRDANYAV